MAKRKRPLRPEDIYLLRMVSDPQLSPDGKRVAYTVSSSDEESDSAHISIYVAPVDGRAAPVRFTQGEHDHSPHWSPDGRYLAFVSSRGEKNQIFLAPLAGGEPRQLTAEKFGVSHPSWSPDGKRIAYVARVGDYKERKDRKQAERVAPRVIKDLRYRLDGVGYFDERRLHIFTIEVETEESQQITNGDWYDDHPSWSPDGRLIAFVSDRERDRHQRQWRSDLWVVPSDGGRARKVTRSRGSASFPKFSPDGRSIAFIGHEHGEASSAKNTHLLIVPAGGGRGPRSVSASLDRSVAGTPLAPSRAFSWSRDGKSIYFLVSDRARTSLHRAGVANGSTSRLLGGEWQIDAFQLSADGKRVVFTAAWATEPPEVYVAALPGGRRRMLSDANASLRDEVRLGTTERMTYKAADGRVIEAFVCYPPSYRKGRSYPMALQIHGGPHSHHPIGLNLAHQALAGAGFVVLMPNPRGSDSYGEDFTQACVGDWGGKDFGDLMDGVDLLVAQGVADRDRLFVGGYSYGGFMTSWAVGHTNRFRAAVVGAPVADHISMFGTTDIPIFSIYEHEGTVFDSPDVLRDRSPVTYLPNVKTPVLLVHWEGDLRCPIGQSEELFQGLKLLGKKVEFARYPGGSHGLRTPSQSVDQMRRTKEWYERHMPRPPAPSRNGTRAAAPARRKARART